MVRRLLAAALLAAFCAGSARAAAVSWTAVGGGDWNDPAGWSGGVVPGPADSVSIAGVAVIAYATAPAPSVGSLSLGAGGVLRTDSGLTTTGAATLFAASALQIGATAPFSFGSLVLNAGSSATYVAAPVSAGVVPPLVLTAGTFSLAAGSTVTVAGRGYAGGALTFSGAGPGAGGAGVGVAGGGGGAHRGTGGDGGGAANGGAAYDAVRPAEAGSGGGGSSSAEGGAGGGFLEVVAGTATVDGFLSADGEPGVPLGAYGGGGGAGGAVVLRAQYLYGAGRLSALGATGGAGGSRGGGGGGGGAVWASESDGYAVVGSTLVLRADGAFGGAGTIGGTQGGNGSLYADPRHWNDSSGDSLASNPFNWSLALAPSGGERLVFGSSNAASGCTWNLPAVAVGSVTVVPAYQATVAMTASMSVSGSFDMAAGTVSATAGLDLSVGGALTQSGGRLDVNGATLTVAAAGASVAASFYDARTGTLIVGGAGAATATVSGLLEVTGLAELGPAATLSLSSGTLRFDGNGPFAGPGSVNASTASTVLAAGSSTQTWTGWPGRLGDLRARNGSLGGLVLAVGSGPFVLDGTVTVDTATILTLRGSRVEVGRDWRAYGTVLPSGSTVAFRASAGTQTVSAGAYFDNLVVDAAGAAVLLSTWVVVADSVAVMSGTLDLAASTLSVRGNWTEVPGAGVLGGTSVAAFDGNVPQTVYQLGGNSFGLFRSSSAAQLIVSTTLAAASNFEWHRGNLIFSNASLSVGGDMLVKGGILLTVNGSTVVFTGSSSTQVVNFATLGGIVDGNTGPYGLFLGGNIRCESFRVLPGAVLNGGGSVLTVTGSSFDTAQSTYYATTPAHQVILQPAGASVSVAAGSVVNGSLILDVGKTAVLLGDLSLTGAGTSLDPHLGSTLVIPPGGSTIAFRGGSDFKPTAGGNWTFGGDVGNSWLVFEGTGTKGASISTNTFGSVRVTLATGTDTFKTPSLNLLGGLYQESGTVSPIGSPTIRLGGDLLQNGGFFDWASNSTGTIRLIGPSTQTVRMLPGFHSMYHFTDDSTATVTLASDLLVRGDFVVQAGTFAAVSGDLRLQGRVLVSTASVFAGAGSTVTLDGATVGVPTQNIAFYGGGSLGGLTLNVANAVLPNGATAQVLTAALPGGTLTVGASTQLTVNDLRLGGVAPPNVVVRSSLAGSPWYLNLLAVSSVTATTVSDSNASPGRTVAADDGRSTDGGGNVNWNFKPGLLVLLPGETFTPGAAPGKAGTPFLSTAGVAIPVSVFAVSSHFDVASATGVVTLTSDDAFASLGAPHPLVGGSTVFVVTPFAAEPSPRSTHFTATTFFGTGLSTAAVYPSALARLQIVLPGEAPLPGSPSGRSGLPFPRVKAVPFTATVRAVDSYWNVIATVTDSYALGTTASSATLPAPPALVGGVGTATGLILYTTGLFTLSATDLTQPLVISATSSVFGVAPPSVSSPTAAFYVPTGAAIATLGGAIAGTASDSSSIALVRVDVLEVETGLHYDGIAAFVSATPVFSTTTLAAPLSPSTSWATPVPDGALVSGRHYAATALVDDPSGFVGVAASTFVVDRSALSYGSRSGQGSGAGLPSSTPGCEVVTATLTYTVNGAGIGPGGAVAVRAPDGWTVPAGYSGSRPPPPGFWNLASTSAAVGGGSAVVSVAPAGRGSQALGPGWLLVSVPTSAPAGFLPGEQVSFQYTGLPPLSSAGRGPQVFETWATADASAPLAPISTQPVVTLTAGTTSMLAFVDASPLTLGPLQTSTTMALKVVDLCGNDKLGLSSGTANLSLVVPANGAFTADAAAVFRLQSGASVSSVGLSTGFPTTAQFTVATSTVGPTLAYVRASAFFPAVSTAIVSVVMRPVALAVSSASFAGVSVDTGTDSPGQTTASFSSAAPDAYPVRIVFTLADPAVTWDAVLSTDPAGFASPVFAAAGGGDASRPIVLTWDGVDRTPGHPPRSAPAATYRLRLRAGGGMTQDVGATVVVPPSAGYTGSLGAAGAFAAVRALGPGARDGAFTTASSTGYFALSGLRAGQTYALSLATTAAVGGVEAAVSTTVAAPPATLPLAALGSLTLPSPARARVSALLPVPAPFDAVGAFVGRAADGSPAFARALRFSTGAAVSDDGGPLFGRAASTWSV
ncbi:MAG: hypothetical protein HY079_05995, partial [Elusimicrobia bacterium]|nr:hypothetical protein [Elusimicrobiota bacterium]